MILSAISASSELQERTKALIRADWEAENKGLLADAQKELDVLNAKLESVNTSLTEAQEAFNKTKLEEERLSSVIAEKEKLAENVEAAVADRIEMARKNAAGFIANMAFVDRHPNEAAAKQRLKQLKLWPSPWLLNIMPIRQRRNSMISKSITLGMKSLTQLRLS